MRATVRTHSKKKVQPNRRHARWAAGALAASLTLAAFACGSVDDASSAPPADAAAEDALTSDSAPGDASGIDASSDAATEAAADALVEAAPDGAIGPCPTFKYQNAGKVSSAALKEASGIAASRKNANVYWAHGDSGQSNHVFALRQDGTVIAEYQVAGTTNKDWEDIAVGPGPTAAMQYLYIGDIGNNGANAKTMTVYRVPEPKVDGNSPIPGVQTLSAAAALNYSYEDKPHNAETLFVDPVSADIYVVTKNGTTGVSYLYSFPAPQSATQTTNLKQLTQVQFGTASATNDFKAATGGDLSPDGSEIVIRTIQEIHLWRRSPGTSVAAALATPRCTTPRGSEGGGSEAIAFTAGGTDLLAITETTQSPLSRYVRQ